MVKPLDKDCNGSLTVPIEILYILNLYQQEKSYHKSDSLVNLSEIGGLRHE
ncbi:MAG: hypothetical protein N5P05_004584 [Chroococcopsis gigantea SAG 12.99]|nr:hypothetical protein [Chroococcopsis gigantea SAG 12.99]